jgi:hypothetical protein
MFANMNGNIFLASNGVKIGKHDDGATITSQRNDKFVISAGSLTSVVINQFYAKTFKDKQATLITQHDLGKQIGAVSKEFKVETDTFGVEALLQTRSFVEQSENSDARLADLVLSDYEHAEEVVEQALPATEDAECNAEATEVKAEEKPVEERNKKSKALKIKRFSGYTKVDIEKILEDKNSSDSDIESDDDDSDEVASVGDLDENQLPACKLLEVPDKFYFSFECPKKLWKHYTTALKQRFSEEKLEFNYKGNEMFVTNIFNCFKFPPLISHVPGLSKLLALDPNFAVIQDTEHNTHYLETIKGRSEVEKRAFGLPAQERKSLVVEHYKQQAANVPSDPDIIKQKVIPAVEVAIAKDDFKKMTEVCCYPESAKLLSILSGEGKYPLGGGGKRSVVRKFVNMGRNAPGGEIEFADFGEMRRFLTENFSEDGDFNNPEVIFIVIKKILSYFTMRGKKVSFKPPAIE